MRSTECSVCHIDSLKIDKKTKKSIKRIIRKNISSDKNKHDKKKHKCECERNGGKCRCQFDDSKCKCVKNGGVCKCKKDSDKCKKDKCKCQFDDNKCKCVKNGGVCKCQFDDSKCKCVKNGGVCKCKKDSDKCKKDKCKCCKEKKIILAAVKRVNPNLEEFPANTPLLNITDWNTIVDIGNNFNPATGVFTAPSNGLYEVEAVVHYSITRGQVIVVVGTQEGPRFEIVDAINPNISAIVGTLPIQQTTGPIIPQASLLISDGVVLHQILPLRRGQKIALVYKSSNAANNETLAISNDGSSTTLTVKRL